MSDATSPPPLAPTPPPPPLAAYSRALHAYSSWLLRTLQDRYGLEEARRKEASVEAIADALSDPRTISQAIADLPSGADAAVGLAALCEASSWPTAGLAHALHCLGFEARPALRPLLERGLAAAWVGATVADLDAALGAPSGEIRFHPSALRAGRPLRPERDGPPAVQAVRQAREADGLEPLLRLAAVWQRVAEGPLRQTQSGTLYKRDRDRLEDDPALAGPIADAIEPLPDMADLWLALARGVGLVDPEPGSDRLVAASPDSWEENAYHLTQMVAARWLSLRDWHETHGLRGDDRALELGLPYVRPAALLWLATAPEGAWVALDDLTAHLDRVAPGWDRPLLDPSIPPESSGSGTPDAGPLEAMLLGAAYQLGLVRTAEHDPSGRRVVQLTPFARYVLALGPPPPPRHTFDHFLFIQPNFEIIAYRQGLTPPLIGRLGRFAHWSRIGAAVELKLTPESVYRGLEGGLGLDEILSDLGRHSQRDLPAGVADAVRTWSNRRERVTYHAAATLMEFADPADLEVALSNWPEPAEGRSAPIRVGERLLLVEDEGAIPWSRLRMAGSRDYRRPPETCVEVEPDGVTLALDLGRSDLLVDAELTRFADEIPPDSARPDPRRRFAISAESLARAAEDGLGTNALVRWFAQRSGAELPAAIRLMLHAASGKSARLSSARPLVLRTPTAELLDGLLQHPATRDFLGERLGPTSVVVPDHAWTPLERALSGLGLAASAPTEPGSPPTPGPGVHAGTTARRPPSGRDG